MPEARAEAVFTLDRVCVTYGHGQDKREVLRDVNLSLFPGQRVALYGPNGSGKTTLFRCITGLVRPQRGAICFHGIPLQTEKDFTALRRKVGFVLQQADDQLFFPTVLEDVAFGPLNLGLAPDEARERALNTLADLDLKGFENRLVHQLSGGEKKLVSLAGVLAMRPEALLLDEPTNVLDNAARGRLTEILRGLDTARVVISHDWDFLAQVAGEYLTIEQGRLNRFSPSFAHAHSHAHPLGNEPHGH
ncbi:MAG: energy-coupling factor ABC transporter ATP-binding protein [Desulfovibrio sp.]|jgi:cobalt/nickel transport system ATP-binding protein|nr:energy-coupling factor ABC transporter ATP-binding protein [Desulfovibrio sp.]